jgi:hypothetical protein
MSLYQHAIGQKMNVIESKIAGLGSCRQLLPEWLIIPFILKGGT